MLLYSEKKYYYKHIKLFTMKHILFACAALAVGLASCSNDDTAVQNAVESDQITFAPTADNGNTRAADVYCNTNMPTQFKVYAATDGKIYINGDVIEKSGSTWENTTGKRYWPDSAVDFYAQANGDDVFKWDDPTAAPTFANFTVKNTVAQQADLLYAVKTNQTKTSDENQAPVALNFHHALSQVVFYAKNVNPNIYVEITGVSVGGVKNNGTYTFPTSDTDANVAHGTTTGTSSNGAQGTWAYGTTTDVYDVTFPAVQLVGSKTATAQNLTDNTNLNSGDLGHAGTVDNPGTNSFGNAMLLLPQGAFTALPVTADANSQLDLTKDGVYFKVLCTIYNVSDPSAADLTDNVKIWDNKEIYIPVSGTWNEGMKYVYTLVFGEGNGGIDPDGPHPVLVPITYNVSVDEFIPVSQTDIEMNYNKD